VYAGAFLGAGLAKNICQNNSTPKDKHIAKIVLEFFSIIILIDCINTTIKEGIAF
jgi:hypothetical protein